MPNGWWQSNKVCEDDRWYNVAQTLELKYCKDKFGRPPGPLYLCTNICDVIYTGDASAYGMLKNRLGSAFLGDISFYILINH
jgi:hypothetical protein